MFINNRPLVEIINHHNSYIYYVPLLLLRRAGQGSRCSFSYVYGHLNIEFTRDGARIIVGRRLKDFEYLNNNNSQILLIPNAEWQAAWFLSVRFLHTQLYDNKSNKNASARTLTAFKRR